MSKATNIAVVDLNELAEAEGLTMGFEVPANTQVKVIGIAGAEDGQIAFQVKSACLGVKAKQGERAVLGFGDNKSPCAVLTVGGTENVTLDLHMYGDFSLSNTNAANTSIHIVGRLVEEVDSDDDEKNGQQQEVWDSDDDDEEAQEDGFFFGGMGGDDDDDEEEDSDSDDEDDEDDEDDSHNNTRVSIEQLPSDEEEEPEPVAKKVKMTPKDNLKFAVPAAVKKAQVPKPITKDDVVQFVVQELKTAGGKAKASDVGASVARKFGKPYKNLGFEEKTLGKLLQSAGKVSVKGELFTLN
ncbi:hypothetical protein BASA81_015370 [Batrachochytrium salamandrivorans]|nr:hypothetical protein BASA81_015370 [Batrachochytrium salamandrivorans]